MVSCGKVPGVGDVAIVDPQTRIPLGPGETGEIWVRGPHIGSGYWHRPDETRLVFEATFRPGDEDAYLRTGDLGFLDDGELYVTGRIKDLLIIRGAKHSPEEVELTLAASHPALADGLSAAFAAEDVGETRLIVAHELDRRQVQRSDLAGGRQGCVRCDRRKAWHSCR